MTDQICEHIREHEWYRKEITADGTVHYLHCHECGREWSFETDHTLAEASTILNRQLRLLGHEMLRAVGFR